MISEICSELERHGEMYNKHFKNKIEEDFKPENSHINLNTVSFQE